MVSKMLPKISSSEGVFRNRAMKSHRNSGSKIRSISRIIRTLLIIRTKFALVQGSWRTFSTFFCIIFRKMRRFSMFCYFAKNVSFNVNSERIWRSSDSKFVISLKNLPIYFKIYSSILANLRLFAIQPIIPKIAFLWKFRFRRSARVRFSWSSILQK